MSRVRGLVVDVVHRPITYHIDREDRLHGFNAAWDDFARGNGGAALDAARVDGKLLWDYLEEETAQLYRRMVQRLRDGRPDIRFQFRCDAPDRRRLLAMHMSAAPNGDVEFVVTPVAEEGRALVPVLDPALELDERFVVICAWCKRVELAPGAWAEVEEAVPALGLFHSATRPRLTHGICPDCSSGLHAMLDDREPGAMETFAFGAVSLP